MRIHGILSFGFSFITSCSPEEASDEDIVVEASRKGAFDASPTMSIIDERSPSIA
jgi:hypothetical protein